MACVRQVELLRYQRLLKTLGEFRAPHRWFVSSRLKERFIFRTKHHNLWRKQSIFNLANVRSTCAPRPAERPRLWRNAPRIRLSSWLPIDRRNVSTWLLKLVRLIT